MRRYISIFCVALIVVMCMVSPVSAADLNDTTYFNVMNYSLPNSGSGTLVWYSEPVFFEVPYGIYPYVDFVVRSNSSTLNAYSTPEPGGSKLELNVILIGTYSSTYLYRVYGNTHGYSSDRLYIDFTLQDSSYVDFLSFYASNVTTNYFDSDCNMTIGTVDYDSNIHFVSTDEINYRTFTGTSDYMLANYTSYLYNLNWKKYDYIDYIVFLSVDSVTTITCTMGGVNVPFEISFIDNDAMLYHDFMISIRVDCRELDRTSSDYPMVTFQGNVACDELNMIAVMSCYGVVVNSLDIEMGVLQKFMHLVSNGLTNIGNLISTHTATLKTQATLIRSNINTNFESLDTWISTMNENLDSELTKIRVAINDRFAELDTWITDQTTSLVASIEAMDLNLDGEINKVRVAINTNFTKLDQWLLNQTETLENAIRGDTTPGDNFQDDVDEKDSQLDQMAAVMDSVDQPDLNKVNVSADTYVDSTILAASMSGITAVIGGPVFLDIIMMSLMMATAGYVLFGKR